VKVPEGKFTKILVKSKQESVFSDGQLKDHLIGASTSNGTDSHNIVTCASKSLHRRRGYILVCEDAQVKSLLCVPINFFSLEQLCCVCQTCSDVLIRQTRIILLDSLFRPSLRKQTDDKLNGKSRPLDDRFSNKDVGIDDDSGLPFHR